MLLYSVVVDSELEAYLADFEKDSLGKIRVVCVCCNEVFKTYCFARYSIK